MNSTEWRNRFYLHQDIAVDGPQLLGETNPMPKRNMDALSPEAKALHGRILKHWASIISELHGDVFFGDYRRYFRLPRSGGKFYVPNELSLLPWLHTWADAALRTMRYGDQFLDATLAVRERDARALTMQRRVLGCVPELYTIVVYKKHFHALVRESLRFTRTPSSLDFSECDAFFTLAEIDKSLLTANWATVIICHAEYYSSHGFFERLGAALTRPGFRDNYRAALDGLAVILLWHLGGRNLTYSRFLGELNELGYCQSYNTAVASFQKMANRLGLVKYREARRSR